MAVHLVLGLLVACGTRPPEPVRADARAQPPASVVGPSEQATPRDAGTVRTADAAAEVLPAGAAIPALAGVLVDERLVVVEPDSLALRAIDLPTRRVAWRTAFRSDATGALSVERMDRRVYVHAGNVIALVDVDTGAVAARRQGPWNQVEHRAGLWRAPGVCAIGTECSMQLVDCADMRSIGAPVAGNVVRRYPLVEGRLTTFHHTGCWGWRPFVLGRAGDVLIVTTDRRANDPRPTPSSASQRSITVALDFATGAERWTSDAVTCTSCEERASGVSPDGSTCWLGDLEGTVRVFDCATGRHRFDAGLPAHTTRTGRTSYDAMTSWTAAGLVVSVPPRAVLHEPASGRALWSRRIAPRTLALPIGGLVRDEVLAPSRPRALLLLDPTTGEVRTRKTVPPNARLLGAGGSLRIEGTTLGWAADGAARSIPPSAPRSFDVERGPGRTTVRAGDRTVLLDEPVDGESLGEVGIEGRPCVVIRLVPRDRMGEIRVICG